MENSQNVTSVTNRDTGQNSVILFGFSTYWMVEKQNDSQSRTEWNAIKNTLKGETPDERGPQGTARRQLLMYSYRDYRSTNATTVTGESHVTAACVAKSESANSTCGSDETVYISFENMPEEGQLPPEQGIGTAWNWHANNKHVKSGVEIEWSNRPRQRPTSYG